MCASGGLCIWKAQSVDLVGIVGDPQNLSGPCTANVNSLTKEAECNL
jgi:hypothetical protein